VFDKWFYTHLGQTCGPVTGDELNELAEYGELDREDMIWREAENPRDGVRAGHVLIFFLAGGKPQPRPAPPEPPPAPPEPAAAPPGAAPAWLADVADARTAADVASPAGPPAALDWLQDVRRAEEASGQENP
jgi:GYF domain 2